MGMDIHCFLVDKDNKVVKSNLFDGRNSEMFRIMSCPYDTYEFEYRHFPARYLSKDDLPEELNEEAECCFGFHYATIDDILKWWHTYRPDMRGAWVSLSDAYRIGKAVDVPVDEGDFDVYDNKPIENPDNYTFLHYIRYTYFDWLIEFIINTELTANNPGDYKIVYFFDR